MTEQQTNDFALWFEQFMDPELNLTPGDKELCQHAWQAALSHAERREFQTEQDLISFLDGLYETAGPDSSALTGQKWAPAQRAIEGIRSHAEGEAQPVALEALAFVAQAGDAISSLHLAKFEECIKTIRAALSRPEGQAVGVVEPADHQTPAAWLGDKPRRMVVTETAPSSIQSLPEGTKLYTHPAPQVAMPEGYALVPEDMLTHFRDFHDAVRTLSKTADPDGYWEHQCEVCKRIESQLAAAPTVKESLTVTPTAPAGEPEFYVEHKVLRSAMAYVGIAAPESDEELGAEMERHAKRVIRAAAKLMTQFENARNLLRAGKEGETS